MLTRIRSELSHHPRLRRRLISSGRVALALVLMSLALGMAGYHWFARLDWVDEFLNSAMLLGGMGQVDNFIPTGGKIFAGLYALYAGLAFLLMAGLLFTPLVHHVLQRFRLEDHPDSGTR